MSPRTPTITHPQPPSDPELQLFDDYYIHSIYTDGSWAVKHTLSSFLLNAGEVSTAGAIVLHTNRGLITVKVDMDLDTSSAFEPEVLSLLIPHEISRGEKINIWTDFQFAIKTLNGGKLGSLSYTLSGWSKSPLVSFK